MAAILQYLKHWFQSLFGTVKQEFDGTVKKEEVVQKDIHEYTDWNVTNPTEKDIAKDVSKILEKSGVKVLGEATVNSDDQIEIKPIEDKVSKEEKPSKKLPRTSKLTMDQARAIRADRHIKTIKELATEYSVSTDTIKRIIDNKTYKEC